MSKITIEVEKKNVDTVLSILNNLKDGLILNIEVDKNALKSKSLYQPKLKTMTSEDAPSGGKYMSVATYKKRLKEK